MPTSPKAWRRTRRLRTSSSTYAEEALAVAQGIAPVSGKGSYRASLYAEDGVLGSTSSFWGLVEYGSVNNPPYAVLRTAIAAVGCDFSDPEGDPAS